MKIGVITDIHEDLISLKKAIEFFEKNNCNDLVCLGDIVGFDPNHHTHSDTRNSSECIHIIKENCKYIVAGNHDIYALDRHKFELDDKLDYNNILHKKEYENLNYNDLPLENFSIKDYEFIENLPKYTLANFEGNLILLSHSVFPDITGKLLIRQNNTWEFKEHINFLKSNHCKFSIGGHLHSKGITKSDTQINQLLNFGKLEFDNSQYHYSLPSLVQRNNKFQVTIIDFNEFYFESFSLPFKIKNSFSLNVWFKEK